MSHDMAIEKQIDTAAKPGAKLGEGCTAASVTPPRRSPRTPDTAPATPGSHTRTPDTAGRRGRALSLVDDDAGSELAGSLERLRGVLQRTSEELRCAKPPKHRWPDRSSWT